MLSIKKDLLEEISKMPKKELLHSFLATCLHHQLPFAIYRLPNTDEIIGISDFQLNSSEKSERSGFVISPFITDGQINDFINADFHFKISGHSIHISEPLSSHSKVESFLDELNNAIHKIQLPDPITSDLKTGNNYISITQKAIEKLKEGKFQKVVLARNKKVIIDPNVNLIDMFLKLEERQKASFISLFYLPGKSLWIGASPEVLVSRTKDGILRTMALAATQKAISDDLCQAVWTQKEIEEQALVARYIINCFKSIRLREFEEYGPKTVRSGNLLHLKTEFSVNINEVDFTNLENQLINLLHPTSAVCGMPKIEALNFIHEHENLDRKYYSGYLGPINMSQESHIFVNIRCAEISGNTAILYSGAGITAGSNPEKEFEETELKMQFLENLFLNIQ